MGRPCTVCDSPHLGKIDEAIVSGTAIRLIARKYAPISRDSIERHRNAHVSPALQRAGARRVDGKARTLLSRVESIIGDVEEIVASAREQGAPGLQLQAIDRMERLLRLLGSVSGELKGDGPAVVVNIATSPEWLRIRGVIFEELQPYPEIRQRIAARLGEVGETGSLRSPLPPDRWVASGNGQGEVVSEQ